MRRFSKNAKKTSKNKLWYESTSDNIFEDLGHSPEEAGNLLLRSDLLIEIAHTIQEQGLSQAEAAQILGVTQPRISELINGRINKFKIDVLVKYLNRLGKKAHMVFESSAA